MRLTEENYYAQESNWKYWSVSQYKQFTRCEAAAMAQLRGEYEPPVTKALLVGSFFDAYFDGSLEQFKEQHKEIFTRKKELRAEFRQAQKMIERAKKDPLFMKFMSGEAQKIMTAELFGAPWKVKIDSFIPDTCIADLKSAANFRTLPRYRYDMQGAVYQEVARLNGYGALPFYLAVCTKERTPGMRIYQIPQSALDMALREIQDNMPHFIQVKSGEIEPKYCGACDYCKTVQVAEIHNYLELLED